MVHLASIDGKVDTAEKEVLLQLLKEYGIDDFNWAENTHVDLNDFKNAPSKAELLFLALRIVRADGIIHPDEVAYCKSLAIKLNFDLSLVDHYTKADLPDLIKFTEEITHWTK